MTVFLTIILIFYLLYLLSPYILAFVGKRLIRRMQKNFEAATQGAERTKGGSSNPSGKKNRSSQYKNTADASSQHTKIFSADEGQYVDFEEV